MTTNRYKVVKNIENYKIQNREIICKFKATDDETKLGKIEFIDTKQVTFYYIYVQKRTAKHVDYKFVERALNKLKKQSILDTKRNIVFLNPMIHSNYGFIEFAMVMECANKVLSDSQCNILFAKKYYS